MMGQEYARLIFWGKVAKSNAQRNKSFNKSTAKLKIPWACPGS
jgi:hypothetical protein